MRYASVVVLARMHGCFGAFCRFGGFLSFINSSSVSWMDVVALAVEEGFGRGSAHV